MSRRVVVTGMGLACPLGIDVETAWARLVAGESGAGRIRQFDCGSFPVQCGCEVDLGAFPTDWLAQVPHQPHRALVFGLWAAERAWADAGLAVGRDPDAGVVIGVGGFPPLEQSLDEEGRVAPPWEGGWTPEEVDAWLTRWDTAWIAGAIGARVGAGGLVTALQGACASGGQAVGEGVELVRHGVLDRVLTGGTDSMLTLACLAGFHKLKVLATHPDPTRAARPFDATRQGFVMGEGAGVLVLESLDAARARGARIHCEVLGHGAAEDAWRFTDLEPNGRGPVLAMARALADAGLAPERIDYINAHGTATPLNDRVENDAIKQVFGAHAYRLSVSSTKAATGHMICAAGGTELIFSALALRDGVVPPTLNLTEPEVGCDLDYVPGVAACRPVGAAMSNSFGFGGQMASVVLGPVAT